MVKDLMAIGNTGAAVRKRALTPAQDGDLADVPPELEWLANITNPKTRRAYKIDVSEFSAFASLRGPAELRTVTRAMDQRLIEEYLALAGRGADAAGPRVPPGDQQPHQGLEKPLNPNSIYRNIIQKYGLETGIKAQVNGLCVHSLRATAATNALSHEADIAKVQEGLGHANVSTTRLHDRRKTRPEDSPTSG